MLGGRELFGEAAGELVAFRLVLRVEGGSYNIITNFKIKIKLKLGIGEHITRNIE